MKKIYQLELDHLYQEYLDSNSEAKQTELLKDIYKLQELLKTGDIYET